MGDNDERIDQYINATQRMIGGDYAVEIDTTDADDSISRLGANLQCLAQALNEQARELQHIQRLTNRINAGMLLPDILDMIYDEFHTLIPYDRIGFSIIEYENNTPWVRAYWSRTNTDDVQIDNSYRAPLRGSSLERIAQTLEPRIINDLRAYYATKPASESTRRILREGIHASLTCPLVVNGNPVGFMFFSSRTPNAYQDAHVALFKQIAGQLSVTLEKGWLITELAQKQAAIEEQNAELRRLHRTKNNFLGMAAHDLRNPIGNIQSVAEMLIDPSWNLSAEEREHFLSGIIRQSAYMLAILDDLLDITQIENNPVHVRQVGVDVQDLLRDVVARHQFIGAAKGSRVELLSWGAGTLHTDPVRLTQILDNLISNGLKFSPPNSLVTVSCNRRQHDWYFEVRDQGPGIPPDEADQLFQEFARLSSQPTAGEVSTGLGLAITRRIVETQGGTIGFYNHDDGGAAFWFTLPAPAADEADISQDRSA